MIGEISQKIHNLRKKNNLTLKDLSKNWPFSEFFISNRKWIFLPGNYLIKKNSRCLQRKHELFLQSS